MQVRRWTMLFMLLLLLNSAHTIGRASSDSLLINQLVQRIANLQVTRHKDFLPGMFPSYRRYQFNKGAAKNDDNIFFTALIISTLRRVQPYLHKEAQAICDSIFIKAGPVYARFRNRKGRLTYNFWQTASPRIFPNAGWLNVLNKTQSLPDDMDDTAILLLAMNAPDSVAKEVHRIMQGYTYVKAGEDKRGLAEFAYPAYSTWFGKKVPAQLDVCVLTNILYMVHSFGIPYSGADSASLMVVKEVVKNRRYITDPKRSSPHYGRTPILLYHIARLMEGKRIEELEPYRLQLVTDAKEYYSRSEHVMDKLLLSTALLRWGICMPDQPDKFHGSFLSSIEQNDFSFFVAGMFSVLPHPFFRLIDNLRLAKFYYYCPAYNDVLLLENLIWQKEILIKGRDLLQ